MKILPKGKKGFNNVILLVTIITIQLLSAIFLPMVTAEVGTTTTEYATSEYQQNIIDEAESVNALNFLTVIINMVKLSTYDIGDTLGLPLWLDLAYTMLFITSIIIAVIIIRGGGS